MDRAPRARSRAVALSAALVAVALVGAACSSGGKKSTSAGGGSSSRKETTTTAPPVAPFTGLPLSDTSIATRAPVMIKVADDPHARPQSGLEKADVIYEERVEGNLVRFLTVFQSQDASSVGPVRSVRSSDASIVAAIGGVFVFSGGIPAFKDLARAQGVVVLTEDDNGSSFHLRPDRDRPYKTYASTSEMRSLGKSSAVPHPLFSFLSSGQPFAAAGATPTSSATVSFGAGTMVRWDWSAASGKWLRFINGQPHRTDTAGQLSYTNVILQTVPYRATPYRDRANSGVDEAVTVGSGDAVLLTTGGQRVALKWSKADNKTPTAYTDASGAPIKLPPGQTWIALVPASGGSVSFQTPAATGGSTTTIR